MTHALVFGASGFIGRHVVGALEHDRRAARVSCPGRDRCDLSAVDTDELAAVLRDLMPDVVVNCTGRLDGAVDELIRANTLVTAKLIAAIGAVNPAMRFVRLGSAGEYGRVARGTAAREDDPAAPVSEYGVSLLAATRLVDLARAAGRVDGLTLRVFNPIGPGLQDHTLLGRAATQLREAVVDHAAAISLGPLSPSRDFVDVRDVAAAVVAAALGPRPPKSVFNVGSGRAVTAREAVHLLASAAGFTGEVREEGAPSGRSATVDWMLADISRAAEALGWRPAHGLTDSITAIWTDAGGTERVGCDRR